MANPTAWSTSSARTSRRTRRGQGRSCCRTRHGNDVCLRTLAGPAQAADRNRDKGDGTAGRLAEITGLSSALGTRTVIGKAIGILMERYQMNEERAFAFLTRASQPGNIKLRDVAQELVDAANKR
jgi:hypothetical protein